MRRRSIRSAGPIAALVALALFAVACAGSGDDDAGTPATGGGGTATTEPRLSATLNASGATFPKGFYEVVIAGYKKVQPGVTVNYNATGSGAGRQALQDGVVDFAGSDGLVDPADAAKYKGEFLYVPTVAAPITLSYNLGDVRDLTLDADTIARIFQRQVKTWDDPAIAALNPGVRLPSTNITVARRSDGSGTTENFSRYLVAAAPGTWTLKWGSTVEWPADTQAGNGNQGVAQIVKSTVGAVGYVDLSDAKASGLQFAKVKNKSGTAVAASVDGATAALGGAQVNADLSYSPLDADGADAYPITAPTWILVYKNQPDRVKGEAIRSFLRYMLTDAQALAKDVDYAPLPTSLRDKALTQLESIAVPVA
ncbi:MAG TPA: phosphate ABC transporter substrate-binding protein PstS [Acidimicrobiales bacterium]|nr:phosphate ABC transporter substrate-binding protein PstS [Acidimicrobiales bacterium]